MPDYPIYWRVEVKDMDNGIVYRIKVEATHNARAELRAVACVVADLRQAYADAWDDDRFKVVSCVHAESVDRAFKRWQREAEHVRSTPEP